MANPVDESRELTLKNLEFFRNNTVEYNYRLAKQQMNEAKSCGQFYITYNYDIKNSYPHERCYNYISFGTQEMELSIQTFITRLQNEGYKCTRTFLGALFGSGVNISWA